MFEDPNVQSQFHRLDTDEQPIVNIHNSEEYNDASLIAEYVDNRRNNQSERDTNYLDIK